jgi:hypothetical protein
LSRTLKKQQSVIPKGEKERLGTSHSPPPPWWGRIEERGRIKRTGPIDFEIRHNNPVRA